MTGWQAFDAAGRDIDTVAPLYLTNGAQTQPSPLRLALQARIACGPTRGVVLHRKDGRSFQVEESASPIIDRHGHVGDDAGTGRLAQGPRTIVRGVDYIERWGGGGVVPVITQAPALV